MLKRSILFKKNNLPLRQIIKKRMTKSIFLFLLGILSLSAMAQPKLSEEARTVYLISPNLILSTDSLKERRIINWE